MAAAAPRPQGSHTLLKLLCFAALIATATTGAEATAQDKKRAPAKTGGESLLSASIQDLVSAAIAETGRKETALRVASFPNSQAEIIGVLNDRESVLGPPKLVEFSDQNKIDRARAEGWVYVFSDQAQITSPDGDRIFPKKVNFARRNPAESAARYKAGIERHGLFSSRNIYIPEMFYLVSIQRPDLLEVFLEGARRHGKLTEVLDYVDGEGFDILAVAALKNAGAETFGILRKFGAEIFAVRSREGLYLSPITVLFALDNTWARASLADPESEIWDAIAKDPRIAAHIAHGVASGSGSKRSILKLIEPLIPADHRARLWNTKPSTKSAAADKAATAQSRGLGLSTLLFSGVSAVLGFAIMSACSGLLQCCGYTHHDRTSRIQDLDAGAKRGGASSTRGEEALTTEPEKERIAASEDDTSAMGRAEVTATTKPPAKAARVAKAQFPAKQPQTEAQREALRRAEQNKILRKQRQNLAKEVDAIFKSMASNPTFTKEANLALNRNGLKTLKRSKGPGTHTLSDLKKARRVVLSIWNKFNPDQEWGSKKASSEASAAAAPASSRRTEGRIADRSEAEKKALLEEMAGMGITGRGLSNPMDLSVTEASADGFPHFAGPFAAAGFGIIPGAVGAGGISAEAGGFKLEDNETGPSPGTE